MTFLFNIRALKKMNCDSNQIVKIKSFCEIKPKKLFFYEYFDIKSL